MVCLPSSLNFFSALFSSLLSSLPSLWKDGHKHPHFYISYFSHFCKGDDFIEKKEFPILLKNLVFYNRLFATFDEVL